jgi:hypothetical protein
MLSTLEAEHRFLTSHRTYFQTNLAYLESARELRESAIAIDGLLLTDSLTATE